LNGSGGCIQRREHVHLRCADVVDVGGLAIHGDADAAQFRGHFPDREFGRGAPNQAAGGRRCRRKAGAMYFGPGVLRENGSGCKGVDGSDVGGSKGRDAIEEDNDTTCIPIADDEVGAAVAVQVGGAEAIPGAELVLIEGVGA
jgi:hypothetical protein